MAFSAYKKRHYWRFLHPIVSLRITTHPPCTEMHDWLIDGLKVGSFYEPCLLNEVHGFEDLHTIDCKMVKRFDADIDVGGTDASLYFSLRCAILATRKIKKPDLRELLHDKSFLNTKYAPSLTYVNGGTKVCVLSSVSQGLSLIQTLQ